MFGTAGEGYAVDTDRFSRGVCLHYANARFLTAVVSPTQYSGLLVGIGQSSRLIAGPSAVVSILDQPTL
jgi:hypothetical protein